MPLWLQFALRTLLTISLMFGLTKLLGKRQIVNLTFFEYITGITLGSIAAVICTEQSGWQYGIVSLISWSAVALLVEWGSLKSKKFRDVVEGRGVVLIQGGKIQESNMRKSRISSDELLEQLRQKNAFRVADVEFAVLEPTGHLSVLLKRAEQPLTASHLGIEAAPRQEPKTVIMDGQVMDEPLSDMKLSQGWLNTRLAQSGVLAEDVYLAQVTSFGELDLDLYNDNIQLSPPKVRALLLADLKKCHADLELFSLSAEENEAIQLYSQAAAALSALIQRIGPLLSR